MYPLLSEFLPFNMRSNYYSAHPQILCVYACSYKDSPLLSLRAVALPELDVGFVSKVPHSGAPACSQQLQTEKVKRH